MPGRLVSPTLVGRAPELALLDGALDGAAAGRPVHRLLAGEAGVGKSRLARETSARAAARGFRVLTGGCADIGEGGVPYGPIVEALRGLVRSLDAPALEALVGDRRTDLARLLPSLGPAPETSPTEFVAPRLLDALLVVLQRLAEDDPVLFVIEDLHWADAATRDAVAFLARQLRTDRVLLLLTFRADELHRRHPLLPWLAELERSGSVERVSLSRLDEARTGELLAAITGADPEPDVVERTHRRSDGNPFFIEELAGAGAKATGPMPPTLREVLLARIVGLPDDAQAVVRIAGVAGRRVDHELLRAVAAMDEDALLDALRGAVGAHVLVATGDADGDYAFRHALLQEAVYEDLLPGERARLHRAFAEALVGAGPGAGALEAGHWAEVAWHWAAARDGTRAFEASVRAAQAATTAYAFADAQRHGERALEQWTTVADPEAIVGMDRPSLLDLVAQAAWLAGDSRRAVALRREQVSALEGGDPMRLGLAQERLGRALWYHGDTDDALAAHEAAIASIPDAPATPELARVLAGYGQILMLVDRWREAVATLERAVALARETGARQAEGHARNSLGLCLCVLGRTAEGYASLEAALVIAHEIASPDDIGRAYVNLSDAKRYAGDPAAALDVARRGMVAAREVGVDRTYAFFIGANGVQSAVELDAWDEAEAIVQALRETGASGRVHRRYGLANWLPLYIARGDREARPMLDELGALLEDASFEGQFHVPWRIDQAEFALWNGDPAAAVEAIRRGVAESTGIESRWYDERLLRIGVRAAADAAEVARARRSAADERDALETGDAWFAQLEGIVRDARSPLRGHALDEAETELATAAAEHARLHGAHDAGRWAAVRERWLARGNVYLGAYAGWRFAEAALSAGDRAAAADALRDARAVAAHLRAGPLLREIDGLAARARVDLEQPVAAPEPATPLPRDPFGLTRRELDVLPLLVQGRTNRQIADALFISENTAGVHVSNILGKMGASTRTEAASIAAKLGLA